ncbi:GNAT family N-acetyltransferase [Flavobacterium sp.]|uniref:GNAT family N-acetyltransferase n=1 Tax=Flavobacterium sp. TaxID=239 RepID=UPI003753A5B2
MQTLTRTTSENPDFQTLIIELDRLLKITDGDDHDFYSQYNETENIKNVLIFYDNQKPVGCGAFKAYDVNTAEIKRMYVLPEYRGKGIAPKILNELEVWSKELNYKKCILETGIKLQSAIALYLKSGYKITDNYGQYEDVENSICMKKII